MILMVVMFGYYSAREGGNEGVIPLPPSRERGQQWPASPRLEGLPGTPEAGDTPQSTAPPSDYGWADEKKQIVRIPVADELPLAVKKLASKSSSPKTPEDSLLNVERTQPPSSASAGRVLPPADSSSPRGGKSP